jgi:bifunctional non-homologous end joining protein LigD
LLIKRSDEYSRDGDGSTVLAEDRSIASGRTMAAIADGKGRGPKPFILAGKAAADPGPVWDSQTGVAAAKLAVTKSAAGSDRARPKRASAKSSLKLPDFIPPQLCVNMERPPNGPGWVHEIKFDGYRVQLRVQDGAVALKTRKGLDWTAKFGTIANAASRLSNGIIDGEVVALGAYDAPGFAALQGALSEGRTDDLIFFAFDLLFDGGEDIRQRPLSERKARLQALIDQGDRGVMRFVEHLETGGEAVLRSACKLSLEGIVSKKLDAPYRFGRNGDWIKAKCPVGQEVVIGGWSTTDRKFRSLLVGVYRGDHFCLSRPGGYWLRGSKG